MDLTISRILAGASFVREHGFGRLIQEAKYRIGNRLAERRYGIATDTEKMIELSALDIHNQDCFAYSTIGYAAIEKALSLVPLKEEDVSFIDIGAGKGRPCVVAAARKYRSVRGIELAPQLVADAKENIFNMRGRKAQNVVIFEADATQYDIPDDVNLIFIANAFGGQVLASVVDKIEQTHRRNRREMYIVYFNKVHFERHIAGLDWIKKIHESHEYPNFSLGIFKLQ